MIDKPLSGRDAFVIGAIDLTGRKLAIALAEAGATISTTTLTADEGETFYANSVLNETWALGRAGATFVLPGQLEQLRDAVQRAGAGGLVVLTPRTLSADSDLLAGDHPNTVFVLEDPGGMIISRRPESKADQEAATLKDALVLVASGAATAARAAQCS